MPKKRKYTHRKDRLFPREHGSPIDEADHFLSPGGGSYKTRRKRKL